MIPPEERRFLLRLARESLLEPAPQPPDLPPRLLETGAAFVTLWRAGDLRGCMGHVRAVGPLWRSVRDMARAAAADDPRFPPVEASEVPGLRIEISVLSGMEPLRSPEALSIGVHGLYVRASGRNGLLLPHVASERGWDARRFLEQACVKADLPRDAWSRPDAEVLIFTAEVFSESPVVLFVCIENAGRSQMAEAFARNLGLEAHSCGSNPADRLNPAAVEAMREVGFALEEPPKGFDAVPRADVVVTMGCGDSCPYAPGRRIDWDLPDPREREMDEVRGIRDDIRRRVQSLARELL